MDANRAGAVFRSVGAPPSRVDVLIADIDKHRAIRLAGIMLACALEVEARLTGLETFDVLDALPYLPLVIVAAAELLDGPFLHKLARRLATMRHAPRLLIMSPHGWADAGDYGPFLRDHGAEMFAYPVNLADVAASVLSYFTPPFFVSPSLSLAPVLRTGPRWQMRKKASHGSHMAAVRAYLKGSGPRTGRLRRRR